MRRKTDKKDYFLHEHLRRSTDLSPRKYYRIKQHLRLHRKGSKRSNNFKHSGLLHQSKPSRIPFPYNKMMHKERVVLEAVRHQYVVSFAGVYDEFGGELLVGVEEKALEKTDLIPYIDKVTISRFGGRKRKRIPSFLKEHYTVVPVDERKCDIDESLFQQELGMAVLPEKAQLPEEVKVGDKIVLNAVLSKRFLMREKGGNPELWATYLIQNYLQHQNLSL